MIHIKQKTEGIYTYIVNEDGSSPEGELSEHPAILIYPERFEIVDAEIPENSQKLRFAMQGQQPVEF